MSRLPNVDSLPDSPVDWQDIPLGAGQEPNGYGGPSSFQFTLDADPFRAESLRRNPDETWQYIVRVPERP